MLLSKKINGTENIKLSLLHNLFGTSGLTVGRIANINP